jgi:hypothetical protein
MQSVEQEWNPHYSPFSVLRSSFKRPEDAGALPAGTTNLNAERRMQSVEQEWNPHYSPFSVLRSTFYVLRSSFFVQTPRVAETD